MVVVTRIVIIVIVIVTIILTIIIIIRHLIYKPTRKEKTQNNWKPGSCWSRRRRDPPDCRTGVGCVGLRVQGLGFEVWVLGYPKP